MLTNPRDVAREWLLAIARAPQGPKPDYDLPKPNPSISLWQLPPHPTVSAIQSTSLARFTDIVVIGSGITGCSVTKALLKNATADSDDPSRVVVLGARTPISGATGRNGGHLVTPVGHLYNTLIWRYGQEASKEMSRFISTSIERILSMVREMDQELQTASEIRDLLNVIVAGDRET
ncbi:hypothetical protein ACJZ2D_000919 [Fusarium nematophilum]